MKIVEYFIDIATTKKHNGYFCNVGEALTIVILGSFCGLKNIDQIHQWAVSERVRVFLSRYFGIDHVPSYYWLLCLLKMIDPESFNRCFVNWVQSFLTEGTQGLTLSFDGETIRSTEK